MDSGLISTLASLGDMVRLRLLRVIEREELSVGELSKILQLPQSTVSRHLKLLYENGWIIRRASGPASYFRVDPEQISADAAELWHVVQKQLGGAPTLADDDHRLTEVLAERPTDSKAFFGRIVGDWDRLRGELFGEAFAAEALLSFLSRDWIMADLGCGTGMTTELLAPVVRRVIAVDREPQMLDTARQRLERFDNVEYHQNDLTALSIADGSVDAVIVSLVMVYIPEPEAATREVARILKPGGSAIFVDLLAHDRQEYLHTMGHRHLGFDEAAVRRWADDAGLSDVRYRRLRTDMRAKGPGLFVATMKK